MNYKNILHGLAFLSLFSLQAQRLVDFQSMALESNPAINASYKKVEASLEKIPQANSLEDPVLAAGYFLQPMGTLMGEQVFKLSLTQQFPWFGTLKAKGNVLALQSEAIFQDFLNQKALLELQVAEVFYPLVELKALMKLEHEGLALLHDIYNVAEIQYENNELSLKELFQLDMEIEESKTNFNLLVQQQKSRVAQLNSLLNRPVNSPLEVADEPDNELIISTGIAVEEHPLLEALQLQTKSFEAQEKLAQKSALPKFGIGLEYMYLDDFSMNGMQYEGMNMIMPMLSVSLPVFNKKYKSARKEAKLMQEASQLAYQSQLNQLTSEHYQQLALIEAETQSLDLVAFKLKKTKQILELSFTEFENTLISLPNLLKVQQELIALQQEEQKIKTRLNIAKENLIYLQYK